MEGEIGRWEGAGCEREEEGEEVTEVHIVGDILVLRYEIYVEEEIVIIYPLKENRNRRAQLEEEQE